MASDVRSLGKPGRHFSNWATTYSSSPELYFEPETTEEIQQVLAFARKNGKKVKVTGNGHSPSDIACTTDYMINLSKYNHVLQVDKERCQVRVQGGTLIRDLNDTIFPAHDMALSVQGTVSDLTVAGAISTGTHGTGANYGVMASSVVAMEILTASGDILEISEEKNVELFSAARVGLGALGVILTVTLQCEPAFNIHQKQNGCGFEEVLDNLDSRVLGSDHFRFFWFPHTENVVCYHSTRSSLPPMGDSSWFWDMFVGYYLLEFLYWLSSFLYILVPLLNRLYYRLLFKQPRERIARSDRIFNFNCLFKQYVMEYAIPREKTAVVLRQLKAWIDKTRFPAHFPIEVRFVKGDNIALSPATGWSDTCYINIIMYRPYNKYIPKTSYWDEFEKIVSSVGGRPHWAKDHTYNATQFEKLYPQWGAFCSVREKLDPNGMFLNAYLERVLGK